MIKKHLRNLAGLGILAFMTQCDTPKETQSSQLHDQIYVFDGHNDALYTSGLQGVDIGQLTPNAHTDLIRLKEGGVDAQVFAIWTDGDGDYNAYLDQYNAFKTLIQKYPGQIQQVFKFDDLESIREEGKIAAILGVEGGHMMEDNLALIDSFQNHGVKIFTLTWNNSLSWAVSAYDEYQLTSGYTHETTKALGLNETGKEIIKKLNEAGIVIDLSHASRKTFDDVLEVSQKPVVASHSNAFALVPHYRNLTDEQLLAIKENGGLVGINFYSGFLDPQYENNIHQVYNDVYGQDDTLDVYAKYEKLTEEEREKVKPSFDIIFEHIDHIVNLIGVDHVSLGSDFDGIDNSPHNLNSVSDFRFITEELEKRGYSTEDIKKIMGENWIRVFKENEVK